MAKKIELYTCTGLDKKGRIISTSVIAKRGNVTLARFPTLKEAVKYKKKIEGKKLKKVM